MRTRFVPPSYRHDLRKKLQRFDQGDMSIQEYYQELQKGMLRCGIVEDQKYQIVRFYGGLRHKIQDIVDYKEYHSIQCLFQLAMLAEKNCRTTNSSGGTTPSRHGSKSQTPPGVAAKANTSTGHTSDIKCHRCQGFGHMQRDCPSKWTIIATADGGLLVLLILKMKILLQPTFQVPMTVLRRFLVHL
jgi:hypothetical protein